MPSSLASFNPCFHILLLPPGPILFLLVAFPVSLPGKSAWSIIVTCWFTLLAPRISLTLTIPQAAASFIIFNLLSSLKHTFQWLSADHWNRLGSHKGCPICCWCGSGVTLLPHLFSPPDSPSFIPLSQPQRLSEHILWDFYSPKFKC